MSAAVKEKKVVPKKAAPKKVAAKKTCPNECGGKEGRR